LTGDVIRLRLDGFLQQWDGKVVRDDAASLLLHVKAPHSVYHRWVGAEAELEVEFRFSASDDGGTQVVIAVRPCAADAATSQELVRAVAPLLMESVRGYLQQNSRIRGEERTPWLHPLRLWPVLGNGALASPVDCQGKDISLNGIGFYVPGDVISSNLCLYLPATTQTKEMLVSARIVRCQPFADGWQHVGAVLESPWDGPDPFCEPRE
jgi:hypothetical protein